MKLLGVESKLLHHEISKLIELGVSEEWLSKTDITEREAKDLLKGILYLREIFSERFDK